MPVIQTRVTYFLLILFGFAFIASLYGRIPHADEAMFGEHVYRLATEGIVRWELLTGTGLGWENRQFAYHKLFTLQGTLLTEMFGLSLPLLRCLILAYFMLFLIILRGYMRERSELFTNQHFRLAVLILLTNAVFFKYAFLFRPEVMLMTIGFSSFVTLSKGIAENHRGHVFLAAVLAGLCAFTHLNGLIFIAAGGVLLLYHRKIALAVGFGLVGGLTALLYFYDIRTEQDWQTFLFQFTNDPNLEKADFSVWLSLLKVLNEQQRFFHSQKEATFSVVLILATAFNFRSLRRQHADLLVYFAALILALGGLSHGKTTKYGLVYMPYIAIIIALALEKLRQFSTVQRWALIAACVTAVVVNGYYSLPLVLQKVDIEQRNQQIASHLPANHRANILADFSFTFNQIENHRVQSVLASQIVYEWQGKGRMTLDQFFSFAAMHDNEYIILDRLYDPEHVSEMIGYERAPVGTQFGGYAVIVNQDNYLVMRRTGNKKDFPVREVSINK